MREGVRGWQWGVTSWHTRGHSPVPVCLHLRAYFPLRTSSQVRLKIHLVFPALQFCVRVKNVLSTPFCEARFDQFWRLFWRLFIRQFWRLFCKASFGQLISFVEGYRISGITYKLLRNGIITKIINFSRVGWTFVCKTYGINQITSYEFYWTCHQWVQEVLVKW